MQTLHWIRYFGLLPADQFTFWTARDDTSTATQAGSDFSMELISSMSYFKPKQFSFYLKDKSVRLSISQQHELTHRARPLGEAEPYQHHPRAGLVPGSWSSATTALPDFWVSNTESHKFHITCTNSGCFSATTRGKRWSLGTKKVQRLFG